MKRFNFAPMKILVIASASLSGLGKGTISSSIGNILRRRNKKVIPIKIDPYLNKNPGNISPEGHGEVFVLEDGSQVDMDFGNYERMMNVTLNKHNSITGGRIYRKLIQLDDQNHYLGQTIEVVPHLCDVVEEMINRGIQNCYDRNYGTDIPLGEDVKDFQNSDDVIVLIELGGTICDPESQVFVKAVQRMKQRNRREDFIIINVEHIIKFSNGEEKTKIIQHSVNEFVMRGLTPDLLVVRTSQNLREETRNKIRRKCGIEHVFTSKDARLLVNVPIQLEQQGIYGVLETLLRLDERGDKTHNKGAKPLIRARCFDINQEFAWLQRTPSKIVNVALIMKYGANMDSYFSILQNLAVSAMMEGMKLEVVAFGSEKIEECVERGIFYSDLQKDEGIPANATREEVLSDMFRGCHCILVPGGFGQRGIEGKILAISHARLNKVPILCICLGLQLCVVEFARNVLKIADSTSEEFDEKNELTHVVTRIREDDGFVFMLGLKKTNLEKHTLARDIYSESLNRVFFPNGKCLDASNAISASGEARFSKRREHNPGVSRSHKSNGMINSAPYTSAKAKIDISNIPVYINERHRHKYGVNDKYVDELEKNGMIFSGKGEASLDICELRGHPFFVGVQFHPEMSFNLYDGHPLFRRFLREGLENGPVN